MGSRYLTHESEDAFWLRQGAKPHPLAEKEQEKRQQMAQRYINVKILEEQSAAANVSSNGTEEVEPEPEPVLNGSAQGGVATAKLEPRASYMDMEDQEIIARQAHAERIGYKVSTV